MLIATVCFQYYQKLHYTIREESRGYLHEVASRIGSNVDRIIDDNFASINTMASVAKEVNSNFSSFFELSKYLKKYKEYWNYQSIMLIDEMGQSYDLSGNEVFLALDEELRQKIISGQNAMTTTQMIGNREYILFSVPVSSLLIEEKNIVAIAASYDPTAFDKILSMDSFNKQAYSQIITKSGTAITRPSNVFAMKTGYNVLSSIEQATWDSESSFIEMKNDISIGEPGLVGFTLDDMYRYMVYTPVVNDSWCLLTFVPVQAVNEKSDMLLRTTLMLCTLITITFAALAAALILIFNSNKRRLEKMAYVDPVTDGNTIQRFYQLANNTLQSTSVEQHVLVYANIEKFKLLNDQLGRQNCDLILKLFYDFISSYLNENECIGRLWADNFCILIEFQNESELINRFKHWRKEADLYLLDKMPWGLPAISFGLYVISDRNMAFTQMIDRAKLSLKETQWPIDSKLSYAFYDDGVRHRMIREKQLEDRMVEALESKEFLVYLQPKYSIADDCIGGAEALVRWASKAEGMIYPNEFIPLFEKNGFIIQLDLWVFEEVCRNIRDWTDRGLTPVKISVNCSRVHFKYSGFLEPYIKLADKYNIIRKNIEIEITESVVFENSDLLIKIIHQIKDAGFGCSMDDFGSGYSSLNLIQTIPVDTLKLDKSFFTVTSAGMVRVEAVVKNIVSMSKALSMITVAEGVEYPEQLAMLKSAGCDYIQGYIYAKPMSISAFEEFAFGIKEIK